MVDDFSVLVAELERCFGEERVLPSRNELREMNRCASAAGWLAWAWWESDCRPQHPEHRTCVPGPALPPFKTTLIHTHPSNPAAQERP